MIIGADSTGRDGANPFWQFSLALYDRPGVAAACLDLQNVDGLDVNLLLYACFAAARGVEVTEADVAGLDAACAPWRDTVIQPIRDLRRRAGEQFAEGEVKEALLTAELAAERAQQDRIWALVAAGLKNAEVDQDGQRHLAANLAAVASHAGVSEARVASLAVLVGELLPLLLADV